MQKSALVKELANRLDGIEYGDSMKAHAEFAREHGLVIVSGESDDLLELDGAIQDEAGCYDGGNVYIDRHGVTDRQTPNQITAVWCGVVDGHRLVDYKDCYLPDGRVIPWTYRTDIPHECFAMHEDGDPYCVGMVFSIFDLKG